MYGIRFPDVAPHIFHKVPKTFQHIPSVPKYIQFDNTSIQYSSPFSKYVSAHILCEFPRQFLIKILPQTLSF